MKMMKLHWSPKSPFVRKVTICAYELGIGQEIEFVRSVAAIATPNPTLMRDNPLSKIPTLVLEDGTSLFDSVVIAEYLNDRAKPPRSGRRRASCLSLSARQSRTQV